MVKIELHGSAKSNYDRTVRCYATQYRDSEATLETIRSNLAADIKCIKRANTSVASNNYQVKLIDQFTEKERIEIWNEVIPGKERKILTIERG